MLTPHVLAGLGASSPYTSLRFRVDAVPVPQGSLKAYAYQRVTGTLATRIVDDNPDLHAWRQAIARAALAAIPAGRTTYGGPVEVVALFALTRPRRPARAWPTTRPDVDKLARGILDALTGIVWQDDAQVVTLTASKRYVIGTETAHASVLVVPTAAGPMQRSLANVD